MVEDALSALFRGLGRDVQLAQKIEGGEADMHLTDCNVIVECKSSGKADPAKPGSSRKGQEPKTQRRQLADYVEGMIRQQAGQIDFEGLANKPWTGILTDGISWWAWRWVGGNTNLTKPYSKFQIRAGEEEGAFHKIKELLFHEDVEGMLRSVPEDMSSMFRDEEVKLGRVYESCSDWKTVCNKKQVWLELLKGSGMAPKGEFKEHKLFIWHTYLVVVARAVVGALTEDTDDDDPNVVLNEGFVSWVLEQEDGRKWAQRIFNEAFKYDWRRQSTDVLRRFYEHVIPKEERKAYGEYYTPDWVAEMLVERILDKEWMEYAAEAAIDYTSNRRCSLNGIGVLDPTCGSGTFLYHAARRILTAKAFKGLSEKEKAECVKGLVHGIDVHPVAVEMARATLIRALPVAPRGGSATLNIAQGDSLLTSGADRIFREASFPNESKRWFVLPQSFLLRDDYRQRTQDLVDSAKQGNSNCPEGVLANLKSSEVQSVIQAHESLRKLCAKHGNSVWTWLVVNAVAPLRLHARKVDRVLANPPWVRMSDIQVESRKQEIEGIAKDLGLWVGGKNATGFDISSAFVKRCRDLYLAPGKSRAAWVLNRASIKGGNWERFSNWYRQIASCVLDFSEVRKPPFRGAKSCAWIEQNEEHTGPDPSVLHTHERDRNEQYGRFEHSILRVIEGERVSQVDSWAQAQRKVKWVKAAAQMPQNRSGYVENKKCMFRNGATLFPHCLILIDSCQFNRKQARFITGTSNKKPWTDVGSQEGKVPERWIVDTVFSRDLLPFCLRNNVSKVIMPLQKNGSLESDPFIEPYWMQVDKTYANKRGAGRHTPKNLLDRLDHSSALSKQLPLTKVGHRVIYNASGQYIRAAYCIGDVIFEHGVYWYSAESARAARYLVAVLNASNLETAFSQSCKSDRHFDTHIWRCVPIPKYDGSMDLHRELAALANKAEKAAKKIRDGCEPSWGQIKISKAIRDELHKCEVMAAINEAVARLLPDYVR